MTKWAPGLPGVPLPPPSPVHPRRAPTPPLGALTQQAVSRVHPLPPLVPPSLPPMAPSELTPVDGGYEALIRRIYESVQSIQRSAKAQGEAILAQSARIETIEKARRRSGRRTIIAAVAAPIAAVLVGILTVWGQLSQSRKEVRDQTREVTIQTVSDEMVEKIATKSSRMALDASQRVQEQDIRRMVSDAMAARPIPRETDVVRAPGDTGNPYSDPRTSGF